MRPVCVKCKCEMWCELNGQIVQDVSHDDFGFMHGDKFKCPKCGHEVVIGFGGPMHKGKITDDEMKPSWSMPASRSPSC